MSLFFADQDCLGMTYDPNLGKWTLRSSSEPKDSTTNEVSMTKECVDAIGNNKFTSSYTDLSVLLENTIKAYIMYLYDII